MVYNLDFSIKYRNIFVDDNISKLKMELVTDNLLSGEVRVLCLFDEFDKENPSMVNAPPKERGEAKNIIFADYEVRQGYSLKSISKMERLEIEEVLSVSMLINVARKIGIDFQYLDKKGSL